VQNGWHQNTLSSSEAIFTTRELTWMGTEQFPRWIKKYFTLSIGAYSMHMHEVPQPPQGGHTKVIYPVTCRQTVQHFRDLFQHSLVAAPSYAFM